MIQISEKFNFFSNSEGDVVVQSFKYVVLVLIPHPGYTAMESQQAPGTPIQNTESGGGRGGWKEGEGGQ